jgi:hypothetical protein
MIKLRDLVRVYAGNRSVVVLFSLIIVLEAVFLVRTIYPSVFDVVLQKHVFELVVLLVLSQILLLLLRLVEQPSPGYCEDEDVCQDLLRRVARDDSRTAVLKVWSAGLASRFNLITALSGALHGRIRTHIIAQSPDHALDKKDAERMRGFLPILERDHKSAALEVRFFETPATIRSFILCDRKNRPFWGTASWYTYEKLPGDTGIRIVGRSNPAIVLRADLSADHRAILTFLNNKFDEVWDRCLESPRFRGTGIQTEVALQ